MKIEQVREENERYSLIEARSPGKSAGDSIFELFVHANGPVNMFVVHRDVGGPRSY